MRILFAGNYDLAGREIAARLYSEGHRISWLTDELTKELTDSRVPVKTYRNRITLPNCKRIMRAESVSCVIFLTGPLREAFDEGVSNPDSFIQCERIVLQAARAEHVERILFLSSVEAGQEKLQTTELEELKAGERICRSFCDCNHINCQVLRVGLLYGVEEYDHLGAAGKVLKQMKGKAPVLIRFREDAMFDLLEAADLADAVNRMIVEKRESGVCTVTTGYPVSAGRLCEGLARVSGYRGTVTYGPEPHTEDAEDSRMFKKMTGWMPVSLFEKDGERIFAQAVSHEIALETEEEQEAKESPREQKIWENPFFKETMQNLLLFVITYFVARYTADWSDLRFVDVRLLYVVVMSVSFGMRQGLLATALASIAYTEGLVNSGIDVTYILYSVESWIPYIVYGVAGAFAGYVADKREDDQAELKREHEILQEKYDFLKSIYREMVEVKNYLQKQIMISKDSFSRVFEISEELDSQNPRMIMFKTVDILEEIMECHSVAVYVRPDENSWYGRMTACSGDIARKIAPSINFTFMEPVKECIRKRRMFVNTALDERFPAYAMPVLDGDRVIAVIFLYKLEMEKYTVYYKNLFRIVVQMVQNSLVRAYHYQYVNREKNYISGTGIMMPEPFERELEMMAEARQDYSFSFSLAMIRFQEKLTAVEVWERLHRLVRGTDLVGQDRFGIYYALLPFMEAEYRGLIEERFRKNGFEIVWRD